MLVEYWLVVLVGVNVYEFYFSVLEFDLVNVVVC